MQEKANAQEREWAQHYEEPSRSEELERLDEQAARIASLKEKYAKNEIDMDAMQQKAVEILRNWGLWGCRSRTAKKPYMNRTHRN